MNKKFLVAALAGLLTVCGFAASTDNAQADPTELKADRAIKILAAAPHSVGLAEKLEQAKAQTAEKTPGYLVNGVDFVSLGNAAEIISTSEQDGDIMLLGRFSKNDKVEMGYMEGDQFHASTINVLTSDPGFFTGYNAEGFYQLDFSADPFNGKIEVAVIGEPLPGSTVTLILSLAALAVFMGYARRKQQRAAVQES